APISKWLRRQYHPCLVGPHGCPQHPSPSPVWGQISLEDFGVLRIRLDRDERCLRKARQEIGGRVTDVGAAVEYEFGLTPRLDARVLAADKNLRENLQ